MMQRHEILAWLGDDHSLTDEQIDELMRTAGEIGERYPDLDDAGEREAAMTVAYRLMVQDADTVVAELSRQRQAAKLAEIMALAGLRQAAVTLIPASHTEAGYARLAEVDRMTVRKWRSQHASITPMETTMPAVAADITVDITDREVADNWAEVATDRWIDACETAGIDTQAVSVDIDVPDYDRHAAYVEIGGCRYLLTVRDNKVTADAAPIGPSCTHEGRHAYDQTTGLCSNRHI